MGGVVVSSLIAAVVFWPLTKLLFADGLRARDVLSGTETIYSAGGIYLASSLGLLMTGAAVFITHYYTSTAHAPVRKIAAASVTGHATNIIAGLGCRPARHGAASDLHRGFDLAQPQRRRACMASRWL